MITGCLNSILLVIASGLLIICSILFIETIAGLLPVTKGTSKQSEQAKKIKFKILIPAHNEEVVIDSTLNDLKAKLNNSQNIVVVADNCTDATAEIARSNGVQVIERREPNLRGKGYALDYGLNYLKSEPPDVVVFVDADCKVSQGAIEQLIYKAASAVRAGTSDLFNGEIE